MGWEGFVPASEDLSVSTLRPNESVERNSDTGDEQSAVNIEVGYRLYVLTDYGPIGKLWLPSEPKGVYYFGTDCSKEIQDNLYIEAEDGKWQICCIRPTYFTNANGKPRHKIELKEDNIFSVENLDIPYIICVEKASLAAISFRNYLVYKSSIDITIGRTCNNDISYNSSLLSKRHAVLRKNGDHWDLQDSDSANGTYVNGKKMIAAQMRTGDVLFLMGLTIIVGPGFLSIGNSDGRLQVNGSNLALIESTASIALSSPIQEQEQQKFFNREPRKRTALALPEIRIEAPPPSLMGNGIPLLLRMGGPLVMGGTSAMAGHYAMLLSSVLFPILTQKYSDKQKKEYEEKRVLKYTEYINKKEKEIQNERAREIQILNDNYPALETVLSYTTETGHLWERRKFDDDFLAVRLGSGKLPLLAKIIYPEEHFDLEEDAMEQKMFELAETPVILDDVPIMESLTRDFISGVVGPRTLSVQFIKR